MLRAFVAALCYTWQWNRRHVSVTGLSTTQGWRPRAVAVAVVFSKNTPILSLRFDCWKVPLVNNPPHRLPRLWRTFCIARGSIHPCVEIFHMMRPAMPQSLRACSPIFHRPSLNTLLPEIPDGVFDLACTDEGPTGCSPSLVSETHTNRFQSCPISFHDPSLRLVAEVACLPSVLQHRRQRG